MITKHQVKNLKHCQCFICGTIDIDPVTIEKVVDNIVELFHEEKILRKRIQFCHKCFNMISDLKLKKNIFYPKCSFCKEHTRTYYLIFDIQFQKYLKFCEDCFIYHVGKNYLFEK